MKQLLTIFHHHKTLIHRAWNLFAILMVLVSNFGAMTTPVKATGDTRHFASQIARDLPERKDFPVFSRPQPGKVDVSSLEIEANTLDQTNAIACLRAEQHGVFPVTIKNCDGVYRKLLHIYEESLGNNIYFDFSSPNNKPVYFAMKVKYHVIIDPDGSWWLPYLDWFARNPLVNVHGADSPQWTGAYEYTAWGSINPDWWGGFEVRHDMVGYPFHTAVIDSIDMYFSLTPIAGIPFDSTLANCCTAYSQAQGQVGDPINTRTGGFNFPVTDLSIPTSAGQLSFQRRYFSQAKDRYTEPLGIGWTHNQDIRLIFPSDPAGVPGYTLFKDGSGNMYRFTETGNGVYEPYPGFAATLSKSQGTPVIYTLEDAQHNIYTFDGDGKVQTRTDLAGRSFNYEYDTNGRLSQIGADGDTRYLSLGYDTQGRLDAIADQSGRGVSLGYDAAGDLVSVTDVLDNTWHYIYDSAHNLLEVTDPNNATIVRNEYVTPSKTVINFNEYTLSAYDSGGTANTVTIEDSGQTLHLTGDAWDKISIQYPVTDQTILEFDFKSTVEGDVHAIGFDEDNTVNWPQAFKLYGTDQLGNSAYNTYSADAPDWKHYRIRLDGVPHSTNGQYLYFINGHDVATPAANSYFSNIQIYEATAEGKVARQYDGNDNLVVELTYNADGTTIVTDGNGISKTHTYNVLTGTLENVNNTVSGSEAARNYDANFRPVAISAGGNTTQLGWSEDGRNLELIQDAAGNQTQIKYNTASNPTILEDPRRYQTKFQYDGNLLKTIIDPFENETNFKYTVAGQIETITDASGLVTKYAYDIYGQQTRLIRNYNPGYGTNEQNLYNLTTLFVYDSLGRLVETEDPSGIVTRNEYNAAGRVRRTIRNYAPEYAQNYDNLYNIVTEYRYDVRGNTIAVIDTYGMITRTYFDDANRVTASVQNLSGQTIETTGPPARGSGASGENVRTDYVYDDAGRHIATVDSQGLITRTWYNADNLPEIIVRNLSGQGIFEADPPTYNPATPEDNLRTETVYDSVGNVIATIDANGIITRTYYDILNRPVTVVQNLQGQGIEATTIPERGSSLSTSNLRTDTVYDANGNVIAAIDPLGIITRTYYDALNRPITTVRNLHGQAITVETPPAAGTGDENIRTDTYYDDLGRVIASVDALGHVARTYYDSAGRAVTTVRNLAGQDIYVNTPPGRTTGNTDQNIRTDTVYDAAGRRIATIDPSGRVTRYEYDSQGRSSATLVNYLEGQPQNYQDAQNNFYNITSSYEYDALGRTLRTTDTVGKVNATSYDAAGRVVSSTQNVREGFASNYENQYNITASYTYNSLGQQVAVTDPLGVITRTYFDVLGRSVSVVRNLTGQTVESDTIPERGEGEANLRTDTVYGGDGRVESTVNELGQATHYEYDDLGRQVTVTDALGHSNYSEYDVAGRLVSATDAEGVVTHYEYDALGRLTGVWENYRPGFIVSQDTNVHTVYSYDANGNRLSITDGNGHVTAFEYDDAGRLATETDAEGHTWTYDYDKLGNRISMLDANGAETTYAYDSQGQLTQIDYAGTTPDVSFQYDVLGRRINMNDGLGETAWTYDELSRPIAITDPFENVVGYGYDALGNKTSLTYPDEKVVSYQYDPLGRLREVTDWNNQVAAYQYYANGQVEAIQRPNGVDTAYTYDAAGRLTQIEHGNAQAVLASYQYTYDNIGNRTQAIETTQVGQAGPNVTVSVVETSSTPVTGKVVYAFKGSLYTGYSKTTDVNGQAAFSLPEGSYRFGVDVDGTRFYSGSTDHCTIGECNQVSMSIPQPVLVTVRDSDGMAQAGLNVSAYDGETFSGMSGTTDANGQVSLRLPAGEYRFRAELNGAQFWSDTENDCSVPECAMAQVNVTKPVTVRVSDSVWTAVAGQTVHAWQGVSDTGYSAVTDENGQAQFTLPAGDYRFSTEFDGETFWSDTDDSCAVVSSSAVQGPGCESVDLRVALPIEIKVVGATGKPIAGVFVEVFDGDSATSYSATTNQQGFVFITLPVGSYRFRATSGGQAYWSGAANHCEVFKCSSVTITAASPIPPKQGYAPSEKKPVVLVEQFSRQAFLYGVSFQSQAANVTITVLDADGNPRADVPVAAFDGATPSGQGGTTDAEGQVTLSLPGGSYRFRAEFSSIYYWSGTENHCTTPECATAAITVALPATVTVFDPDAGSYRPGLTVHAYQGATDTGYSAVTDENGQASLNLPIGNYRFMVELDGAQFFSEGYDHCDVPNCRGAEMWVFGARTVTVRQKNGTLVENALVEAYTETIYTGLSGTTNENGVAQITLAQGWYRFRVTVPSGQYWSGDQVHCKAPDCKGVTVVVDTYDTIPVSVLNTNGTPQGANHTVTAFTGETATEQSAANDHNGQAILTLLEGNYRFRALYEGAPFWSSAVDHCAIPGCSGTTIEVSLTTQVNVRNVDGQLLAGVDVYVFDGDTYTNFSRVTDDNGTAFFVLPFGSYRFRVDVGGASFWSGTENHYTLPTTWPHVDITVGKPVVVSLSRQSGASAANMTVDVYSGTEYVGRTGTTGADGKVSFTLPDGEYRFRVDYAGTEYWSAVCQVPGCESSEITILDGSGAQSEVTIDYEYDPLYRLTAADYSTGEFYHYTYDAVGNRLSQTSQVNDFPIGVSYEYDAANRLTSAGGMAYTYDANGNLLHDSANEYTYDAANRLSVVSLPSQGGGQSAVTSYKYSGLGDRLQETVNGVTTTFTMDLNTGLTQALSDGTYTYTYGLGRIAQYNTTTEYFLGDALGSVRQLTDAYGIVTLVRAYNPYGEVTQTSGAGLTSYGFTSEYQRNDLVYLRARHYAPGTGRFLTRDSWAGDSNQPMSYNKWVYAYGQPVNLVDPTGYFPAECLEADNFAQCLRDWQAESRVERVDCELLPASYYPNPFIWPSSTRAGTSSIAQTSTQALADQYNITFTESGETWTDTDKTSALDAVVAVASKFTEILGGSPLSAWLSTYHKMTFQMGGCGFCADGSTNAGHTSGSHNIEFAGISDSSPKGRNLVVHELGHAFKWLLYYKAGTNVYDEYKKWRENHPGYPDRPDFPGPSGTAGNYYGFASQQNVIVWQVSLQGDDSEEFADQFLGWTFNMWQTNSDGTLHPDGKARRDMMDTNMPGWVKQAHRNQ